MRWRAAALWMPAWLCGCGDLSPIFEALPVLGPVVVEQPFAVAPPVAPALAQLPQLTPCPAGWRAVDLQPVVCEPWPQPGVQACGVDSAHFVGEPGCTQVGTACPASDWLETFPAGRRIWFVRAGGAAAADGSRAAPYPTLLAAAAVAQSGDVIALAKGTFLTDGPLPVGVTVWGACVAQTLLTVDAASTQPAVVVSKSAGVEVRNLRVGGPRIGLAVSGATARLHVEDVVVDAATSVGWLVQAQGQGTGANVVVRHTVLDATGAGGQGAMVDSGGNLTAQRVVLDDNRSAGIIVSDVGSRVDFTDLAVLGTSGRSRDGKFGRGVEVDLGASASLTRATLERNTEVGLLVAAGAHAQLTDVVVRQTRVGVAPNGGPGLSVDDSTVVGRRVRFEGNTGYGAVVGGSSGQLTLTDAVVADTAFSAAAGAGSGITATLGGTLVLERAWLLRNLVAALGGGSAHTSMTLTDVVVTQTQAGPSGTGGFGLSLVDQATATLVRARFEGNRTAAVLVGGVGTNLVASDLVVQGTLDDGHQQGGGGIGVVEGATAQVLRAVFERNLSAGVYAGNPGTTVTLEDIGIVGTEPDAATGLIGEGLVVADGAHVAATRLLSQANQTLGVAVTGQNTVLVAVELVVRGTQLPDCGGRSLCQGVQASGMLASEGGAISLSRFLVTDNGGFGVLLASGGQVDLADGEVSYHRVGANVRTEGFDVSRLDQRVVYRHNVQKLDARDVPLPAIAGPPAH